MCFLGHVLPQPGRNSRARSGGIRRGVLLQPALSHGPACMTELPSSLHSQQRLQRIINVLGASQLNPFTSIKKDVHSFPPHIAPALGVVMLGHRPLSECLVHLPKRALSNLPKYFQIAFV